jgi:DNA-binding protein HU-beta
MPLTQSQLIAAVADRAELSKAEAKRALDALDNIVLEELGNAQKVRLGGLVQLTVRVKPATKKRTGRNPATGEEITIAAKPASVDVEGAALGAAMLVGFRTRHSRLASRSTRSSCRTDPSFRMLPPWDSRRASTSSVVAFSSGVQPATFPSLRRRSGPASDARFLPNADRK